MEIRSSGKRNRNIMHHTNTYKVKHSHHIFYIIILFLSSSLANQTIVTKLKVFQQSTTCKDVFEN